MRVGTILENKNWEEDGVSRFSVFTGMANGMVNVTYQRETGMDNRLVDLSLVGTGNRFSPVGYINLFGEKSLREVLQELSREPLPVKKGDFVVITGMKVSSHNNALCRVLGQDEKTGLYRLEVVSEKDVSVLLLARNQFRTKEEVADSIFDGYKSFYGVREAERKEHDRQIEYIDKRLQGLVNSVKEGMPIS